ncbi:MAG: aminotransferase class IV [Oscillatoriaceae cyanobacterium Prado104]|jgi:para-aminobenzoate synthetase/4-amino-4-deoxychorismate lyase|nr:aminotransferase class IV [Oscillatoriaceae cyanobacterium Prado104]
MIQQPPNFELLESLLWEPQNGYFLRDRHIERLKKSADYFNFPVSLTGVRNSLEELSRDLGTIAHKVRLTLSCDGKLTLQSQTLDNGILKIGSLVGIAKRPIDPQNPFLYHKTTYRLPYTMALESQPDYRDVILWNQQGFVTESTIANIAIETPTGLITPPVKCGLLPGTFRAQLLAEGKIKEEFISLDDLRNSQTLFLINSVRGWMGLKKEDDRDVWQVVSNDGC